LRTKKNQKWVPDLAHAWITWVTIGFAQTMYVLYVPNAQSPVGLVWGWARGDRFEVAGSFVPVWARRFGVRSRINEQIFLHFKVISTRDGSKEGGARFLKAAGYKRSQDIQGFCLHRPRKQEGHSS